MASLVPLSDAGLPCAGYSGDACQLCGNGYALASGLCQRTLESFQAQAALAGRPAQLPPAPAPGPRDSAVPKVTWRSACRQPQDSHKPANEPCLSPWLCLPEIAF